VDCCWLLWLLLLLFIVAVVIVMIETLRLRLRLLLLLRLLQLRRPNKTTLNLEIRGKKIETGFEPSMRQCGHTHRLWEWDKDADADSVWCRVPHESCQELQVPKRAKHSWAPDGFVGTGAVTWLISPKKGSPILRAQILHM